MSHYAAGGLAADRRVRYVRDIIERILKTWAEAFLMFMTASGPLNVEAVTDIDLLTKAGLSGVAAVFALLLGLVGKKIGSPNTAAWLPAKAETPDP
jgi:Putative lactococcus lactis phage r1t holin